MTTLAPAGTIMCRWNFRDCQKEHAWTLELTDVQEMTRDMVRDFAQNEVKPAALILDKNAKPEDCIPWDLLKKASKLGLRTAAIPEEWGGEGADYTTLALILLELGKADHGFASIIRGCYTESPRLVHELNPEQRDEFLPKFLKDDTFLLGLGRTEPDAGTDSHFLYDEPGQVHPDLRRAPGRRVRHQRHQALHLQRRAPPSSTSST